MNATPVLTPPEIETYQTLLRDYQATHHALDLLQQHQGNLETSLEALMDEAMDETKVVAATPHQTTKSLRATFFKVLRREICGEESLESRVEDYNKNPNKAFVLTGLIVYLIDLVSLPINPAIATILVLWILKIGLRTFCTYTEPQPALV